jgi:hypothetical protein
MSPASYKALALIFFLLALAIPSFAQNTKGDKPSSGRETRFSEKKRKPLFGKREKSRKGSAVQGYRPRKQRKGGEHAQKPVTPLRNTDPNAGNNKRVRATRYRVPSSSASQSARNVYPQKGRFVNNPHPKPSNNNQRAVSNRSTLARLKKLQGEDPKPKRSRIFPRMTSKSYRPAKSINIMARYPRPKHKGEKATTKDIAGRRLRQKNYESPKPQIIKSAGGKAISMTANDPRSRVDRQRYGTRRNFSSGGGARSSRQSRVVPVSASGTQKRFFPQKGRFVNNPSKTPRTTQIAQSNKPALRRLKTLQTPDRKPRKKITVVPRSASRPFIARKSTNTWAQFPRKKKRGEKAVLTDIAGRKLRTKNFETPRRAVIKPSLNPYYGRKRTGDKPYKGERGGYVSATKTTERAWKGDVTGRRIRTTRPHVSSAAGMGGRGYKSASKSGEKRTGRAALPPKQPGRGAWGLRGYRGFSKGARVFMNQGEEYAGGIKSRRQAKGGGSRSGNLWNNDGIPVNTRIPKSGQGELYSGSIKARRPVKGGGSRSGQLWNNDGTPISTRIPKRSQGELYAGNLKAKRAVKGRANISGYPGKMKRFSNQPGFLDQGEEYTGSIKAKRPEKGGGSVSGKLWNNKETPIAVKTPSSAAAKAGTYTGELKTSRFKKAYVKNPNAAEEALKKKRPDKSTYLEGGLQIKVARRDYVKNPNASALALKKLQTTKATHAVGELQVKVKQYNYIRSKGSENALKVREPGKAFARATDYQGNIKMQKYSLFGKNRELHPDAKFVKINKNNVAEEKDALTNFKLWWSRLFRKNETQPDHLKEKIRKPRYDKGEAGLWYD